MKMKIKKHEYRISSSDRFMDNGSCIQLLTQSMEPSVYGSRPHPVLSKKNINEIYGIKKKHHKYPTLNNALIFSLMLDDK